jgi:hypothetical protein
MVYLLTGFGEGVGVGVGAAARVEVAVADELTAAAPEVFAGLLHADRPAASTAVAAKMCRADFKMFPRVSECVGGAG